MSEYDDLMIISIHAPRVGSDTAPGIATGVP